MRRHVSLLIGLLSVSLLAGSVAAGAAELPLIRFGHGVASEEPLWLLGARPDLAPNQGKKYRLKLVQFPGATERVQAYLARELDGGTLPGFQVIFSRAQGVDIKTVASVMKEARGKEWFSTTFMVKEDGPIKTAQDLKGRAVGILGFKTSLDFAARAYLLSGGLVPDKDVKVVPMPFPAMGSAVRSDKVAAGAFVEPFYSVERAKGGLRPLFTSAEAVGYDHELLVLFLDDKLLKAEPEAARGFLADYVAAVKYYLANREQAKRDIHKAGFVRTPLDLYLKQPADYKRDPDARIDVASLKKLAAFMYEKLGWLEKPVDVEASVDQTFLPQ